MAAFLQTFSTSSMPKRLLRYALSQLELLDTDALDIDNLDLAWGRNTVLEFRDVGLRLKKLDKLLQLGPSFKLQRARVLLLRITVPMNFYSSPITVEVDRVIVSLLVADAEPAGGGDRPGRPLSPEASAAAAAIVPNAADLAQSFLAIQPPAERRQLEEALALAAERNMSSSSHSLASDDESEEDAPLGTGQPLSLPGFMTGFLQGIVDRLQVQIKHVTFQLDTQLDLEPGSPGTDLISVQLSIDSIDIQGVTMPATDEDGEPVFVPKEGKRRILLNRIRAYLISEAGVFSAFEKSPAFASPEPSQSPAVPDRHAPSASASATAGPAPAPPSFHQRDRLSGSSMAYPSSHESFYPLRDSEAALEIPYNFDGPGDLDEDNPSTPRASQPREGLANVPDDIRPLGPAVESGNAESGERLPSAEPATEEAAGLGALDHLAAVPPSLSPSPSPSSPPFPSPSPSPSDSDGYASQGPIEDLTQSHIYSHEEAESMYMSAFSQAESQHLRSTMPSSWHVPLAAANPRNDDNHPGHPHPTPLASSKPHYTAHDQPEPAAHVTTHPTTHAASTGSYFPSEEDSPTESPAFLQRHFEAVPIDEPPEGDAETPRGPPRLVKEIISLPQIAIYAPSQQGRVQVSATTETIAALNSRMPGAFSAHLEEEQPARTPKPVRRPERPEDEKIIDVILTPVLVRFDASLAFLLISIIFKLLGASKGQTENRSPAPPPPPPPPRTSAARAPADPSSAAPQIHVVVESISFQFLDHLGGVADTPKRILDPEVFQFDHHVLLELGLRNLRISRSQDGPEIKTAAKLQKLQFGFASSDILSFDPSLKMRESVRDLAGEDDVTVDLVQSSEGGGGELNITTLPLHVQLDLQRLDETFGWFGGLSSFLNMSASVSATPTATPAAAPKIPRQPPPPPLTTSRQRTVRFGRDEQLQPAPVAAAIKANARIGAVFVEVIGRECTLALESSALKLVSRSEGIGVSATHLRFSGPYMTPSSIPPITVDCRGARSDFYSLAREEDLDRLLEIIMPSRRKDDDDGEIMVDMLLRQRRKGPVLSLRIETAAVRVANLAQLTCLPTLGEELARLSTVAKYLPEDDRPGLLMLPRIESLSLTADFRGEAPAASLGSPSSSSSSNVGNIGVLSLELRNVQLAHITLPSLLAVGVEKVEVGRNGTELVTTARDAAWESAREADREAGREAGGTRFHSFDPVLMVRMIGDEIEPVVKLRIQDLNIEYQVDVVMEMMGLGKHATPQEFEAGLAASVATLGERAQTVFRAGETKSQQKARAGAPASVPSIKPTTVDMVLRDCLIGLNPLGLPSKMVVVLAESRVQVVLPAEAVDMTTTVHVDRASILLVDSLPNADMRGSAGGRAKVPKRLSRHIGGLCSKGFVDISLILSTRIIVHIFDAGPDRTKRANVHVTNELFLLETCADSTQTLIALANALKPPSPPEVERRYRTDVMPVQDLLASISADAFGMAEGDYDFDHDFLVARELNSDLDDEALIDSPMILSQQHQRPQRPQHGGGRALQGQNLFDADSIISSSVKGDDAAVLLTTGTTGLGGGGNNSQGGASVYSSSGELLVESAYIEEPAPGNDGAKTWNSAKCSYGKPSADLLRRSPITVSVRDGHVMWHLFDGYDWASTRDVITKAVREVEAKASEKRARRRDLFEEEVMEDAVIADCLFNSIYIEVPRDPHELSGAINHDIVNDTTTETGSVASTALTGATATTATTGPRHRHHSHHHHHHHHKGKKLRLGRSREYKITFDLAGVGADMVVYPPDGGETLSSVDVRVRDLNVLDNIRTSTWKKFATYDQDAGPREAGRNMVHLEVLTCKPDVDLAASELVIRATVQPLRLHVDQDALDFITRFFEFRDDSPAPSRPGHPSGPGSAGDQVPFLQRVEVKDISVKLDFKPKRVDYGGIRSGRTTEFMNFVTLDEARMTLRHTIIRGCSGFDRLGKMLNDIWMPDIRKNQLGGILAGLAPVRPLVDVGSGFRDLVEIPMREYRKDGRVIRSISKGAYAWAKTTGTELIRLGAKIAVGTQYALQGAEGLLLAPSGMASSSSAAAAAAAAAAHRGGSHGGGHGVPADWDEVDDDEGDGATESGGGARVPISLYAMPPIGVVQGLRGGYASLMRDLSIARDAIVAVPAEVMESGSAQGAAKVVLRKAPTIIFRPAIGASKAIGQTLMGATNSIDPANRRRVAEKYKR